MDKKIFTNPIFNTNPITVLVLGICSALAVTVKLEGACVMALSVMIVTGFSSMFISLIRNSIPNRIRIIVQLVIVALFVILIDQALKAFAYDLSKQLSVYVGLIITNCIIMGRTEGFALKSKPLPSLLDGLGNGIGYLLVLCVVATIREVFGSGTWFGMTIFETVNNGGWYVPCGLLVMPPCSFFLLGLLIWGVKSIRKDLQEPLEYDTHREDY